MVDYPSDGQLLAYAKKYFARVEVLKATQSLLADPFIPVKWGII